MRASSDDCRLTCALESGEYSCVNTFGSIRCATSSCSFYAPSESLVSTLRQLVRSKYNSLERLYSLIPIAFLDTYSIDIYSSIRRIRQGYMEYSTCNVEYPVQSQDFFHGTFYCYVQAVHIGTLHIRSNNILFFCF